MSSDKAFRPPIWLATGTFSALLAIQLLFHASDLRAHQDARSVDVDDFTHAYQLKRPLLQLGGASLFMALLLARITAPGWRRGWTLALAICLVATTRHNIRAWAHASTVTQDFLSEVQREVPDPEAGTEFVFYGMPRWTEGGVYLLLHRALADSIQDAYHRDDLTARRDDEPPHAGAHPSVALYWVGDWRGKKRPLVTKAKLEVQ